MKIYKIFLLLVFLSIFSFYCKENKISTESSGQILFVDARGGLRMRETFDLNSKVLTLIPEREEVKVIEINKDYLTIDGKEGYWYKVQYKEYTGWVFGGFLTHIKPLKCMNLTKENLNQLEGGCLGSGCYDKDLEDNKIIFNKDKSVKYFFDDRLGVYSVGTWEIIDGEIFVEVDYTIDNLQNCALNCSSGNEDPTRCANKCAETKKEIYGKSGATLKLKQRFYIKGDSFFNTLSYTDPESIPGKKAYEFPHPHSEPNKHGCMRELIEN